MCISNKFPGAVDTSNYTLHRAESQLFVPTVLQGEPLPLSPPTAGLLSPRSPAALGLADFSRVFALLVTPSAPSRSLPSDSLAPPPAPGQALPAQPARQALASHSLSPSLIPLCRALDPHVGAGTMD